MRLAAPPLTDILLALRAPGGPASDAILRVPPGPAVEAPGGAEVYRTLAHSASGGFPFDVRKFASY